MNVEDNAPLNTELIRALVRANGGALFVHVWEFFITLDDEVEHIWSRPNSSWIKWVFFFMRYFTFITQIVNRCVDMAVVYDFHLSIQSVKLYYMLGVVVAQAVMLVVEIVMMVRVYALYARNTAVKYVCVALIAGSIVIMLVGLGVTIPGDDFQPSSLMLSGPKSFAYFAAAALVSQLVILFLSLARCLARPSIPLLRRMAFDGTLSFTSISFVCLALLLSSICGWSLSTTSYAWLLCLSSAAGCRLILNLQRLPVSRRVHPPESLQLTTLYPESAS